jgi:hypothetical protein
LNESNQEALASNIAVLSIPQVASRSGIRAIWPTLLVFLAIPIFSTLFFIGMISTSRQAQNTGLIQVPFLLSFKFVVFVPIILILCANLWTFRRNSAHSARQWNAFVESGGNAPWASLLKDGLGSKATRWRFWRKNSQEFKAAVAATAIRAAQPSRIALVVPSIAPTLDKHRAPPGLLELEEIGHSFSKSQAFAMILPIFLLGRHIFMHIISGAPWGISDFFLLVTWCVIALFVIAWFTSALGERFLILKTTRGIVRAGPGFADDRNGRRWTVEDSVLIVRELAPHKKPLYQAVLLGPQGSIIIPIGRAGGQAFINLWQRWTTPNPRLDLMQPIVAQRELRLISRLWRGKWVDPSASGSSGATGV